MSAAIAIRRPKFRFIVATTMMGFIAAGIVAMGIAAAVAFRKLMETIGWIESSVPTERTSGPSGWVASMWEFPSWQAIVAMTGFALAMLLTAFLIRKIVLAGLRD